MSEKPDEIEAFAAAQAAGRKKRLLLLAGAALAIALVIGAGVALSRPSECETLAAEVCAMAGMADCSQLTARIADGDREICRATLTAMASVPDKSMKQALATKAMSDLIPETAALQRALAKLPADQKLVFLEKFKATPENERDALIQSVIDTGRF